jgi:FAD/FMN-containing dehydrogenase
MGEYTDGIERINIELSIKNKLKLAGELHALVASGQLEVTKADDATGEGVSKEEILGDRPQQADELLGKVAARWSWLLANLDQPLTAVRSKLAEFGLDTFYDNFEQRISRQPQATLFDVVQDHTVRVSWKADIRAPLRHIFNGAAYKPILDEATAIHQRVLRSRVFVALHMHAGDGNVHTNLPVNSDDYAMLQDSA